jgi:hypothetical protein
MLKYAVLKVQENQQELKLNRPHYLLVYSDDINMLRKNINTTTKITEIYSLLAIRSLTWNLLFKTFKNITDTHDTIRKTTHHHRTHGLIGDSIPQKLNLRMEAQQFHQQF